MMSLLDRFEAELDPLLQGGDQVHGGLQRCASWTDAARAVARLCDELNLQRVVIAQRGEFAELERELVQLLGSTRIVRGDAEGDPRDYAAYEAGIGGAEVLVAECASIGVITPGQESPALSLLPETHIVVVPASRIVERLADALGVMKMSEEGPSPSLTFITGPSRTADIEKILVLPAHGPSRLYVFVIEGI